MLAKSVRNQGRGSRGAKSALAGVSLILAVTAGSFRANAQAVAGKIAVDGSSTVFPITEAVAEEFQKTHTDVKVTVGISGTGGGFKKFGAGETDISDASRPVKQIEIDTAAKIGVDFIELPVAYDGITVVVNKKNKFLDTITVADLKKIWEPESKVKTWKDVNPKWPAKEIKLYGPGHDSGTFDYFTEAINGKEKATRSDYTGSEDDNVLVQGVAGDQYAMGYFGVSYYEENKDKLKALSIDAGKGPVSPGKKTIVDGTYQPLSRPLFIYVSTKAVGRPEVQAFVKFYLTHAKDLVSQVGYVPLPDEVYQLAIKRFEARKTGSIFGGGGSKVGVMLKDLLAAEK